MSKKPASMQTRELWTWRSTLRNAGAKLAPKGRPYSPRYFWFYQVVFWSFENGIQRQISGQIKLWFALSLKFGSRSFIRLTWLSRQRTSRFGVFWERTKALFVTIKPVPGLGPFFWLEGRTLCSEYFTNGQLWQLVARTFPTRPNVREPFLQYTFKNFQREESLGSHFQRMTMSTTRKKAAKFWPGTLSSTRNPVSEK